MILDSAILAYHFALLTSIISIIQVPFNAVIISNEKMKFFGVVGVVEVCLKLSAVCSVLYKFDGFVLYSILIFIISILILLCYYFYSKSNFEEVSLNVFLDKKHSLI